MLIGNQFTFIFDGCVRIPLELTVAMMSTKCTHYIFTANCK